MCGIVAAIGNLGYKEEKMFRDMLIFDTVRGRDSTGVVRVPRTSTLSPEMVKQIGGPTNLWDWGANTVFGATGSIIGANRILIGHNRAATVGVVSEANAHPFQKEHIWGVHNGSLDDYSKLEGALDPEMEVDSEILYNHIAKKGVKDAWENCHGAATLVFYDQKEDEFCFIRNKERPLYYAENEARNVAFFASEPWMIRVAADRHDIKLHENKVENDETKVYKTKPITTNRLFRFKVTGQGYELVASEGFKELAKKPIRAMQNYGGNGYTSRPGFTPHNQHYSRPKTNYSDKSEKRKAQDFLNTFDSYWAANTTKEGKETRGLELKIVGCGTTNSTNTYQKRQEFFNAVVKTEGDHEGMLVKIVAVNWADYEALAKHLNRNENPTIKTTSRMRARWTDGGKTFITFVVSSANVKILEKPVQRQFPRLIHSDPTKDVKDLKNEGGPYNVFRQKDVPFLTWDREWKEAGGACCHCSNPIPKEEHSKTLWISPNSLVCNECADSGILDYLNIYP